jgi:cell division inhibitor SepF
MSALRKAGVWLGLVEEDDDRLDVGVFDDDFAEEEDDYLAGARTRSLVRPRDGSERGRREVGDRDRRDADRDLRERDLRDRDLRDHDLRDREPRGPDRDTRDRELGRSRRLDLGGPAERERPRLAEPESRLGERGSTGGSVRPLTRPTTSTSAGTSSSTISFPTQDNLALAPQVQLSERAVVTDDTSRRSVQITTLHPTTYSEARTIGEHFRDGVPVIMNLTEMDEADAKRLVDFAAGLAFGLRGGMERVTNRVFLLSPPNIQVSAEDKARIASGGFFNQD